MPLPESAALKDRLGFCLESPGLSWSRLPAPQGHGPAEQGHTWRTPPVPASCPSQQGPSPEGSWSHLPLPVSPAGGPPLPAAEAARTPGSKALQTWGTARKERILVQLRQVCAGKLKTTATLSSRGVRAEVGRATLQGEKSHTQHETSLTGPLPRAGRTGHVPSRPWPRAGLPGLRTAGGQEQPSGVSGPRARGQAPTLQHSGQRCRAAWEGPPPPY